MDVAAFEPAVMSEWDAFVNRHPLGSYGHLSANFALADATPEIHNVSIIVRDRRDIVGVLPLFEVSHRVLRAIHIRELVSGAFFPAGPLISASARGKAETKILDLLLETVRARATDRGADAVIISHPNVIGREPAITQLGYSPLLHYGYRARPGVGMLIDLGRSAEEIAAGRRSGCRQSINKAQAAAATVGLVRDQRAWMSCYDLNIQTLGDLAYSEQQLAAIWEHFIAPGHACAYAVYSADAIAAVAVTVHTKESAYYWIGWSRRPTSVQGAGHLALWSAIQSAQQHGCRYFELGSLDFHNPKNSGISQFKQSFGGVPFQTISAQLDLKPVKSAALAFAEATVTRVSRRRRGAKHASEQSAP
jgi:hypothetical protein